MNNPAAFMTLVGKVLPLQLTGEDGGPIKQTNMIDMTLTPREAYFRMIGK